MCVHKHLYVQSPGAQTTMHSCTQACTYTVSCTPCTQKKQYTHACTYAPIHTRTNDIVCTPVQTCWYVNTTREEVVCTCYWVYARTHLLVCKRTHTRTDASMYTCMQVEHVLSFIAHIMFIWSVSMALSHSERRSNVRNKHVRFALDKGMRKLYRACWVDEWDTQVTEPGLETNNQISGMNKCQ
jgi:hypothetical protein